jgi:hypothetical protein
MAPPNVNQRKKILVFGDWVVDDYWVTGIHRSPTASRTGRAHHRSLHPLEGSVLALCGAGRTASVLHEAVLPGSERLDVVGIGIWHEADNAVVRQLIDAQAMPGLNPFRLTSSVLPCTSPCAVVNLAAPLSTFLQSDTAKALPHDGDYQGIGTTRMIRIFQNTGTRIELLERVDWELRAPFNQREGVHAWFPDPELYATDTMSQPHRNAAERLERVLPDLDFPDVEAVVIKDLGKGCVSTATVRWLKRQVPGHVPWFISSKSWLPPWFKEVPPGSLRLLMVPQVAARTAIYTGNVRRWLTGSGIPTWDAIACIDELSQHPGATKDKTLIVVLPEKQQAIFRGPFEGGDDCHVQRLTDPVDLDFEVAMASVLLPALVAHLLQTPPGPIPIQIPRAAASFTDAWMEREVERIEATEALTPSSRLTLNLNEQHTESGEWRPLTWATQRLLWTAALKDMGILPGPAPSIELARATTVLDGYVCLVSHKQDLAQRLIREARRFVGARNRTHISMLITASPGSGKSALIDALVKSEKLASYTINLAQLTGRLGVIDEFDTVATLQAQNRETPLLVFVDEINSLLDSQHLYDLFLSAMQNGEYVREGGRFKLDPCIWIFAGTAKPTLASTDPSAKGKDFESRLTLAPLSLDPPTNVMHEEMRLERVYLGVAVLLAKFPDVRKVTRKVLRLFHSLPIACTVRDLVKLVSSFEHVQLGKVHSGNVPETAFAQIEGIGGFDFSEWSQHDEEGFVMIVAR